MNAIAASPFNPAIIDWRTLDERERIDALARPAPLADAQRSTNVRAIIADVRARGDEALREFTARFDGCALDRFEVGADEFAAAWSMVPAAIRDAMRRAIERVETFHVAQKCADLRCDTAPGVRCEQLIRPIQRVGLYAPAGGAPLPSTVWMLAVPARVAGCAEALQKTCHHRQVVLGGNVGRRDGKRRVDQRKLGQEVLEGAQIAARGLVGELLGGRVELRDAFLLAALDDSYTLA